MLEEVSNGSKSFIKLNFDFPSFHCHFPEDWLRYITPSELKKAGFQKVDPITYRKSFSDIVELKIVVSRKSGKSYAWNMNEEKIKVMLGELESIKTYLDRQAERHYDLVRSPKNRKKFLCDESYATECMMKTVTATNTAHKMKKAFMEKYSDFLNFNSHYYLQTPIFKYRSFFFDACKNTHQLHLYFDFVELFVDVFGALKKSKPHERRISPEAVKLGIAAYYAVLFTIKKVRSLYLRGASFGELTNRFPMISEKYLEDITLEAQAKKGWAYKASNFALDFASYTANTTMDNFKQVLKKEKKFGQYMKKEVGKIKNIEEVLAGKVGVPKNALKSLKIEIVPKEDWIGLFRWSLSHLGPFDENKLPF